MLFSFVADFCHPPAEEAQPEKFALFSEVERLAAIRMRLSFVSPIVLFEIQPVTDRNRDVLKDKNRQRLRSDTVTTTAASTVQSQRGDCE